MPESVEPVVKPVLKWMGGKKQILKEISKYFPADFKGTYFEPFLGGGSVLFEFSPKKAVVNDLNSELVNMYRVVKEKPDDLVALLKTFKNEKEFFLEMRSRDRDPEVFSSMSDVERAARTIYLNRTCFNGMYRVNLKGEFNVPFAYLKNPDFVREGEIKAVSDYLNKNKVEILNGNYLSALKKVKKGDFVYFDPPYDPVDEKPYFVGYVKERFGEKELAELAKRCHELHQKGAMVVVSDSATKRVKDVFSKYPEFKCESVYACRWINSKGDRRGPVEEYLFRNF